MRVNYFSFSKMLFLLLALVGGLTLGPPGVSGQDVIDNLDLMIKYMKGLIILDELQPPTINLTGRLAEIQLQGDDI
jgi:hypothetical protein